MTAVGGAWQEGGGCVFSDRGRSCQTFWREALEMDTGRWVWGSSCQTDHGHLSNGFFVHLVHPTLPSGFLIDRTAVIRLQVDLKSTLGYLSQSTFPIQELPALVSRWPPYHPWAVNFLPKATALPLSLCLSLQVELRCRHALATQESLRNLRESPISGSGRSREAPVRTEAFVLRLSLSLSLFFPPWACREMNRRQTYEQANKVFDKAMKLEQEFGEYFTGESSLGL